MPVGDFYRVLNWTQRDRGRDIQPIKLVCRDSRQVAIMLMIGFEDRTGLLPLDIEKAMRELGWQRIPEPSGIAETPADISE